MAGDPLDPQPKKAPSAKVFNCTNCGASITLRALGHTVSVACESCGSVIDVANENLQILKTVDRKMRKKPLIPLGKRGKLHGETWEVIGFMVRSTSSHLFTWREYLLFNPFKGFRWLTESEGHWNFVRTIKERPTLAKDGRTLAFRSGTYQLYETGTAKVTYVLGEFYWRVKVYDEVRVEDYIHPPYILTCEQDNQEVNWSHGEYLDPEVVKAAFHIDSPMPVRHGVASNQPSTRRAETPAIFKLAGLFFVLVCVIQLMSALAARNQAVYTEGVEFRATDPAKTHVTPSFMLAGGTANVEVDLLAGVKNSWLSLDGSLVNEQTGAEYEFEQGVEFYSGYDSDGYWSEGSHESRLILSSIPGGMYHLNYQLSGQGYETGNLSIRRGVLTWSNFWWALALLSLFPIMAWWRERSFEMSRWANSDYSPYASSDDE